MHGDQVVQLKALLVVEKLPPGQASQTRFVVPVAAVLMRCPGVQVANPAQPRSAVALGAVVSYCAALHVLHALQLAEFLLVLKLFAPQAAHCRSVVFVGAAVCLLPGAQSEITLQVRLEVAVAAVDSYSVAVHSVSAMQVPLSEYLPVPQAEHTRSDVRSGATLSVSPAAHFRHALQALALGCELKVPAAHGAQVRFDVAVASALT